MPQDPDEPLYKINITYHVISDLPDDPSTQQVAVMEAKKPKDYR